MKLFKLPPTSVTIHHSLVFDSPINNDTEAYRKYHKNVKGWSEIGYSWVVERQDNKIVIQKGRDEKYQGAHCPSLNETSIGICIAGNFDLAAPDDDLLDVAVKLCQDLIQKYNMDINTAIKYHCDYSQKTCPGKMFPKQAFILAVRGEQRP